MREAPGGHCDYVPAACGTQALALGSVIGGALSQSKFSANGFGSSRRSAHTCSANDCENVRKRDLPARMKRAIRAAPRMIFMV